jgi:prepilin-type N-terminal cleavage/methylation domain-containing protein
MIKLRRPNFKQGFTLIELLFAMTFLSILLLVIALLVVHIITLYQKGLTIRSISATGRELIDDVTRSVSASPIANFDNNAFDTDGDGALTTSEQQAARAQYFFEVYKGFDLGDGEGVRQLPAYGAFCTGNATYIYNTAYALNANDHLITYSYTDPSGSEQTISHFKLLKVTDIAREVCNSIITADKQIDQDKHDFTVLNNGGAAPVHMLESDESNLALYDFQVFPVVQNRITGHTFYSSTFILATLKGGVNVLATGNFCNEPSYDLATDFAYCAVNKFNFAMRATGESNQDEDYGSR